MSTARTPAIRALARIIGIATAAAAAGFGGLSLAATMAHERVVSIVPLPGQIARFDAPGLPGDLTIAGTAAGPHRLVQAVHTGLTSPDIAISITDHTLVYRVDGCRWFDSRCGVDLTVSVDPRLPVVASSTGGNIRVSDVKGGLTLSSSGGDVTVRDSAGNMHIESSAGDVRALRISAAELVAHSSAGDVRIELTTAPQNISADSSAGDVEVILPRSNVAYRVEADSSAGTTNVQVQTDPRSTRVVRVSSSAGDVTVRYTDA
jgi:hypothetical protein